MKKRLAGQYEVEIHAAGLLNHEAIKEEAALIEEYGSQLVNIQDPSSDAITPWFLRFSGVERLRDRIGRLSGQANTLVKHDPQGATDLYREAFAALLECANAAPRVEGPLGELYGPWTPSDTYLVGLDGLTLMLQRDKRFPELIEHVDSIDCLFPGALAACETGRRVLLRRARAIRAS